MLLQPTSPLRRKYDIDQIFEIRSKFESDSAVSISLSKEHIELYFKLDSGNKLNPLNSHLKLAPRQEYEKYYTLNGALYLSDLESLLGNKSFISPNTPDTYVYIRFRLILIQN